MSNSTNSKTLSLVTAFLLVICIYADGAVQSTDAKWLTVTSGESRKPVQISVEQSSSSSLEVNISLSGIHAVQVDAPSGEQYTQLRVQGCGATAEGVGLPEMPFKGFFLEIPYGVDVSVDIIDETSTSLGTGFKVHPHQPAQPDSGDLQRYSFQIDKRAYSTNMFFPSSVVVLSKPGFIRGRRVIFVQVFPLKYNPVTTELCAFKSLRFEVKFEGAVDRSGEARKSRLATVESEALAQRLILNYETIKAETKEVKPDSILEYRQLETDDGIIGPRLSDSNAADYLIIVADLLSPHIDSFAKWKHRKGFITRVVTMSVVGSTPNDVNDYIQNAYDNWDPAPSYVLLVGDQADIPSWGNSDHYYACVDGDDHWADLTIGRLPVQFDGDCITVAGKILQYEQTPDMGDWYDKILTAGYFQDDGDQGQQVNDDGIADRWFMETTMTVYDFMVNSLGWTGYTALCTSHWPLTYAVNNYHFRSDSYPHRGQLNQIRWGQSPYPDPVPSWIVNLWTDEPNATADITTAINKGVGLVLHRDHGGVLSWGHPVYNLNNISSLNNGPNTPVVLSINCWTGYFVGTADCLCEAFLKHSNGGCVGAVGAVYKTYSGYNDLLTHGIFTCFWPSYDTSHNDPCNLYPRSFRPAEALNFGKYYMEIYEGQDSNTISHFYLYHWFGDPEMPLRTETPKTFVVTHPAKAPCTKLTNITVHVTQGGSNFKNALVCLSHPTASDHWTGLTDSIGKVTFSGITLTKKGNYDLVVSSQNSVPYQGTIVTHKPVYVDFNSPGANNGSSWLNAYKYLQDALADPCASVILVADGIYRPDANSADQNGTGDRNASFVLKNSVSIYGGYAGYEATDPNERDIDLYKTTLSGDLDGNDIYMNDPCDLLAEPTRAENSYHVVTTSGTDETAVLDGFIVTAGNADNISWPDSHGAGMFGDYGHCTVNQCTFIENSARYGGAMWSGHSDIHISNCTFLRNSAEGAGGGVDFYQSNHPVVANCTFRRNVVRDYGGGGMHTHESNPTVVNCTFISNEGLNTGNNGGGLYNTKSSPEVMNCLFTNNSAYWGGAVSSLHGSSPTITNCTFQYNLAKGGCGGINDYNNCSPIITNCILWDNTDPQISDPNNCIVTVNYSDVQSGWSGTGIGNIEADPCFVESGYWIDANDPNIPVEPNDPNAIWVDGNYRLLLISPCIDVGDNNSVPLDTIDLDGNGNTTEPIPWDLDNRSRFADGDCNAIKIVEMGAYEFSWPYIGDFAGGCDVDFSDLSVLALTWLVEEGQAGYDAICDISIPADNIIDEKDLQIFTDNWLTER